MARRAREIDVHVQHLGTHKRRHFNVKLVRIDCPAAFNNSDDSLASCKLAVIRQYRWW